MSAPLSASSRVVDPRCSGNGGAARQQPGGPLLRRARDDGRSRGAGDVVQGVPPGRFRIGHRSNGERVCMFSAVLS